MKEKMIKFLENYWACGRDHDVIYDFIKDFFDENINERIDHNGLNNKLIYKEPIPGEMSVTMRYKYELAKEYLK